MDIDKKLSKLQSHTQNKAIGVITIKD